MTRVALVWTIEEDETGELTGCAAAPGFSLGFANVVPSFAGGYNAWWHSDNGSVCAAVASLQDGIDWCDSQYEAEQDTQP